MKAAKEFNVDLTRSLMVGDASTDIEAGARAGCMTALVTTGHGQRDIVRLTTLPTIIVPSLATATLWYLQEVNKWLLPI